VPQQYIQTVDVFQRYEVDWSTEEIPSIRIGSATQQQFGAFPTVILDGKLQRLLGEQSDWFCSDDGCSGC
jgi:hypothetical protein